MEELIKQMNVEQLIGLINECADDYSTRFPYIMDNNDDQRWEEIQDCMDAYRIATAVSNGRFSTTDNWLIVVEEEPKIYTFSDKETLFKFITPEDIAQLCRENEIELSVQFKRK